MIAAARARFRAEWPAYLVALFVIALPFRRNAEISISLVALSLPLLLTLPEYRRRIRPLLGFIIPVFLCFWVPMLLSSFDSYNADKSWSTSLAAIRYPMTALGIALLLSKNELRRRFLQITAFVLLFWAVDGYVQLLFGRDLLGIPMSDERLNALFYRRYQFYGPTLAFLSPLLLEYARRNWPAWAWAGCLALVTGAVMIAGMRAGWMAMGIVVLVYGWMMIRQENAPLRRWGLLVPGLALAVVFASYMASEKVQERVSSTLQLSQGTESALDAASSLRLPIFTAAVHMYQAHPVNGIGVRAFPVAYREFAAPDDIHLAKNPENHAGSHAHNVVLEVMADTGTIGLLAWLLATILAISQWRRTPLSLRQEPFPYVLALVLVLFPLNSHFSIFGVYTSSVIWWLIGLWGATMIARE